MHFAKEKSKKIEAPRFTAIGLRSNVASIECVNADMPKQVFKNLKAGIS